MQNTALQSIAFRNYEANQWFLRNKPVLEKYSGDDDIIVNLVKQYQVKPLRILEIGSSAGYRLHYLKTIFPSAEVKGIDPSDEAIKYGKAQYRNIDLHVRTADDLSLFKDGYFDLVIVGFVFYVIDRPLLLKVIGEIDRVLCDKGLLINTDFFSEKAFKNKYHHITEFEAYSFKQNYENIFLASNMYQLIHKASYNHNSKLPDATDNYYDKCSATLLKKDLYATY